MINGINWLITTRMVMSFLAGGVIGLDRERSGKAAGIRTQMLVCVGSSLLASISIYLKNETGVINADPARLMAQIVSGIGFLGAGIILKNKERVIGLTTAATIWMTAAIGIGIGSGFYLPSLVAVIMVLLINPIGHLQYRFGLKSDIYRLIVEKGKEVVVERVLRFSRAELQRKRKNGTTVTYRVVSSMQRNREIVNLLEENKIRYVMERL